MRILFISQYFYPEQFSNNSIAEALVRRGHEVIAVPCVPNYGREDFFEGYSNRDKRQETWRGIRIFRAWTVARGASRLRLLLNYVVYPLAAIREIRRRRLTDVDVTFVSIPSPLFQALVGIYLKRFHGVPTVYWLQDIWPESPILTLGINNRSLQTMLHSICGWIYRRADLLLVQSPGFVDYVTRYGVRSGRVRVFPNTAPDQYFPRKRPKSAALETDAPFRVMFAGNIGESQDLETIVKAADLLREENLEWVIVGSGRYEASLRRSVGEAGLDKCFRFEGRHPQDQMPVFFAQADAMIVSLKDSEIFELTVPYKLQCYLACGRPILGSINGETARIIAQSGAGWAAPAGQPNKLAAIVRQMMGLSQQQLIALGNAGRRYFEDNFAPDLVYHSLDTWLREAAAPPSESQL